MSYTAENKSYNLFICDDCDHNILTSRSFTQHQRTYQTRKNTRADSKNTKKILNLKASSQKWANREDDFVAHAWDMYWEGINSILKNIYLPFTKKIPFWKKDLLLLPSDKAEENLLMMFSNWWINGCKIMHSKPYNNTKSTTSKTSWKIKTKGSSKCMRKKDET